jgi:hypothetical protein
MLPLLGALALLSACQPPPPPMPRADARLILTPAVAGLGFSEPRVTTDPDGRMRVAVDVSNPSGIDYPMRIQTDWLNEVGRPIATVQSRPAFRSIARHTVTTIEADAPNTRARDFRMTLDLEPTGR